MISRRLILAAAIGVSATAGLAQQQGGKKSVGNDPFAAPSAINIAGNYDAEGRYPNGSAYSGQVRISQQGTDVSINWQIGSDSYSGSGLIDGRVVAVDWGSQTPIVYVVMPDGELHGTWDDGRALERLTPN